jgi:dipeptidyl aminopeptidase/acylaminoacyl peptidase
MKSCGNLSRRARRSLHSAFVLVSVGSMLSLPSWAQRHLFSVQDSIEMTTFSDPYTRSPEDHCKLAPNGRYFLVITTKGILHKNQLQSTIWLYRTTYLLAFLRNQDALALRPRLLLRIEATPKARQFDSYGSLITKAQWSSDSSGILFLAETGDGTRRLYRLDIRTEEERRLSSRSSDVEDFAETGGTTVYVARPGRNAEDGTGLSSVNDGAGTVLTGRSLLNIFDPEDFSSTGTMTGSTDLWVVRGNERTVLNEKRGSDVWHYPASASSFYNLALSPDGNALVAVRPVSRVLPSWREFVSLLPTTDFKKLPATEINPDADWLWPWQYIYIDLSHNRTLSIAGAPTAWMAGYGDPFQASWSQDGRRVLVTSTYLSNPTDPAKANLPCAVAVFTVANAGTQCIAYSRYNGTGSHLRSAEFGGSSDDVRVQWSTRGMLTQEVYRQSAGNWHLADTTNIKPQAVPRISLSIRQGLDKPPTLWASDYVTGVSRELWNPNPQLSTIGMGTTSVYRWTDGTGYEWEAGLVKPYGYVSGRQYPLVIQTHGFNDHEFLVDGSYTTGFAAQAFAAAGIMVLQMEDRSDRHRNGINQEANLFAQGCVAAIRQLTSDGLIDPARVGLIGFSRASWYVENTLVNYPQLFKAATLIDGVDHSYVSYILFCAGMPSCSTDPEIANGGPPFGKTLRDWLNSAPGFALDRLQAPLRIEAINWYSIFQEWEIYSSLFQQGKPVEFVYTPHGQHILQQPRQRFVSEQGNVDWFRFWLQGFEDPDPLKRRQYLRWTNLKNTTDIGSSAFDATTSATESRRAR